MRSSLPVWALLVFAASVGQSNSALGQASTSACRPYDRDCQSNSQRPRNTDPPCAGPAEACGNGAARYDNRPPPPQIAPQPYSQDLADAEKVVDWIYAGFHRNAQTGHLMQAKQILTQHLYRKQFDRYAAESVYRALQSVDDELNYRRYYSSR